MGIELLTTTRSFRRRLDLTRPVERRDLLECLDIAVQAPSGSNRQPWRFLVVQDDETKQRIAEFYRKGFEANLAGRTPRPDQLGDLASSRYLAEHLGEVPALVFVCSLGRLPEPASPPRLASFYGSIYPAVWNFMLALRERGLGSCLTTAHLAYEREVADLLGIPFDEVTQVAMVPVAHLLPGHDGPGRRAPAAEVTLWDRWA
ncbi:nitroreductase [Nocardia tenerifensis]|uniref:Nitroreductase n=1 Tax=Nocardia tenerifensis TaxID=228006 RepID=A0A318K090_9NOCA|nr:nitroreductase family protein [Nocardia tenerifensis]PXX60185.1 nitroreductase [Nocardia tenerifensis]